MKLAFQRSEQEGRKRRSLGEEEPGGQGGPSALFHLQKQREVTLVRCLQQHSWKWRQVQKQLESSRMDELDSQTGACLMTSLEHITMVTKEPDQTAAPPLTLKREPLSGFYISIATVLSLLSRVMCTCLGQTSAQSYSSIFRLVSKKHFLRLLKFGNQMFLTTLRTSWCLSFVKNV